MPESSPQALTPTRERVGGWQVRAAHAGAAPHGRPPVVLVHGRAVAGGYLMPLAEQLAADFPVCVPDLPGHGLSGKPRDALTLGELADTLAAWMEAHPRS